MLSEAKSFDLPARWAMLAVAMTRILLSFALVLCLAALSACRPRGGGVVSTPASSGWLTDLPTAQAKAKAENKMVLLDFTGSDWCPWCIRLDQEIFSQPEFKEYAQTNLVLVKVDFPRRTELSTEQRRANEALAMKYNVEGFPTLVVLDSDGKLIGVSGYQPGGPKPFIAAWDKVKRK